jgi:hypothetical protein
MRGLSPGLIEGRVFYILLLLILWPSFLNAQDIAIGQWRHHLPNNRVVSVDQKPGFIYAATPFAILEYDKSYNSIRKYDKVNGLSDFGINVIRYSHAHDLLLIGYDNGNIDVMKDGGFFSISDIRLANIIGSKSINNFFTEKDRAYLSTDFGIVVLDLRNFVILDTWFIGPDGSMLKVYDLVKTENYYYAATEAGLLRAAIDAPNLADYNFWNHDPLLPIQWIPFTEVELHGSTLIANASLSNSDVLYVRKDNEWSILNPATDTDFGVRKTSIRSSGGLISVSSMTGLFIFNEQLQLQNTHSWYFGDRVMANDAITDKEGLLWIADNRQGLVRNYASGEFESIVLEGPATSESYNIAHNGGALWVAPGGPPQSWIASGIFVLQNGKWKNFTRWQFPVIMDVRDIHTIIPHATLPDRALALPWTGGLIELDVNEGVVSYYDETNSTLQKRSGIDDYIRLGGAAFDSQGNLWVSNADVAHFLSVRKTNGQWLSYPNNGTVSSNDRVHKVVIDSQDQKWVLLARGGGVIVFKESSLENNQSINIRRLSSLPGNGSLPGNLVTALAMDKDGFIWAGTNEGVAVFYSPQNALRGQSFDAQPIIVIQDGFAARLFDGETINSIFVDGSNKKWFGTMGSGAFLQSSDGRETLLHFNRNNSPLPSNNILDISVDSRTGEVFFATDVGLVSYRGFATEGGHRHSDVYAFPNPVRPGYSGYIAIQGLVTNARVKITDISGNLVHDGFADGGQFVWNGFDLEGRRPGSGVYLVFSSNADGTESVVTKILYLK